MTTMWKPCDQLTPKDFRKYRVWTFDLSRGENDSNADESWVRPIGYRGFNETDDELFVWATVVDRDGAVVPDCVLSLRLGSGRRRRPELSALILLTPEYDPTPIVDRDKLAPTLSAALQSRLPFNYQIDVQLDSIKLKVAGRLRAWVRDEAIPKRHKQPKKRKKRK
jgi:hypothetical protein